MRINLLPACAITIALITGATQRAEAGTSAYVGGGLLSGTVESCIKNMKTAADNTGFTESQETVLSKDKRSGDFHADSKDSPLHFTATCDPATGIWAIAISGIDNSKTYESYLNVWKAIP
jgi:hypothetical protein